MLRGTWQPRDEQDTEPDDSVVVEDDDDESEGADEEMLSGETVKASIADAEPAESGVANLDALVDSMDSLSLVPRTVRFGRGTKGARPPRGSQRGGGRAVRHVFSCTPHILFA